MVYVYTAFAIILLAVIVFVSMNPPNREGLVATDESMRKMFVDTYKVVDNGMHGLEKMNLTGNLNANRTNARDINANGNVHVTGAVIVKGADARLCIDGLCLTKSDIAHLHANERAETQARIANERAETQARIAKDRAEAQADVTLPNADVRCADACKNFIWRGTAKGMVSTGKMYHNQHNFCLCTNGRIRGVVPPNICQRDPSRCV